MYRTRAVCTSEGGARRSIYIQHEGGTYPIHCKTVISHVKLIERVLRIGICFSWSDSHQIVHHLLLLRTYSLLEAVKYGESG